MSCVRTVHVHAVCSVRTLLLDCFLGRLVLGQCSSISDSVCVNSRTLDIGKACCLRLRQPLILGEGEDFLGSWGGNVWLDGVLYRGEDG